MQVPMQQYPPGVQVPMMGMGMGMQLPLGGFSVQTAPVLDFQRISVGSMANIVRQVLSQY